MKPKTIVSVLESSSTAKDVALTKALSLAQWYGSDVHVLHVHPSSRIMDSGGDRIRDDLVERVSVVAEASGTQGVNIIPAVLSGSPVRAIADYTGRVDADLVIVGKRRGAATGTGRRARSRRRSAEP